MRLPYYCVLAATLVLPSGTLVAQNETGKQLKTKLLAEWKSLLESIQTARWEIRAESHSARDPKHLKLTRVDVLRRAFKVNVGALWSVETERFDEKMNATRHSELSITNRQYTAQLRPSRRTNDWTLVELKMQGKGARERIDPEVRCPWMTVGNMDLDQWIQQTSFVFTRVEQLPGHSTKGFSRAHFSYSGSRGDWSDGIKSGYIDFDSAHGYRPMSYHFNIKSKVEEGWRRGVLEYSNAEGIPVPKTMVEESEGRSELKGSLYWKCITTFANVKYSRNIPDDEFRLSYYGIPEPQGVVWETSSRWYLWFIAAAVLSLAVGAIFWRRAQRRKLTTAQAPMTADGRN